jgi:phage terminase large subunit-like protein
MADGVGSDVAEVAALVGQVEDSGKLDRVGLDPVGIGAVVDALQEVGIEYERLTAVTQGWKLSGAIKTTERELASGKLRHAGQSMMAWCVGNAKVEPRGNAILVTKQAAGRGKIDPLMATFNAIALMAMNPEPRGGDLQTWLDEPIMVV